MLFFLPKFQTNSLCLIPQIQPIMLGLCPDMPNYAGIFRLTRALGGAVAKRGAEHVLARVVEPPPPHAQEWGGVWDGGGGGGGGGAGIDVVVRVDWARWQGLTFVHFSAQPEPFLAQNTPYTHSHPLAPPGQPLFAPPVPQ